ncbi:MAG: hypothetical protein KDE58_12905 [Caldilineaceae bacterium]|nr:hypothetical protein [Caldilineaceae bacterium]
MNISNLEGVAVDAASIADATYCPQHPTVATQMRCNKCGKFICLKCAVQTPVGYRCRACVYQQQQVYFNARPQDNLVALLLTVAVTMLVIPVAAGVAESFYFGAFYLAFIVGPGAGALLVQSIRAVTGRRRSRQMRYFVMGGLIFGLMLGMVVALLVANLWVLPNLPLWIFVGMAATTAYQVLR